MSWLEWKLFPYAWFLIRSHALGFPWKGKLAKQRDLWLVGCEYSERMTGERKAYRRIEVTFRSKNLYVTSGRKESCCPSVVKRHKFD